MIIFDYFKNKKQNNTKKQPLFTPDYPVQVVMLTKSIESLFPSEGDWSTECYKKPTEYQERNLPCHLRDNDWMAGYIQAQFVKDGVNIPTGSIKHFLQESKRFQELRHRYELEIVKWQITQMCEGSTNWLRPEIIPIGYGEISLHIGRSVDRMFRKGIVNSLSAIGMHKDVIEEGIEKNRDMWLDKYMQQSFDHTYNPKFYDGPQPERASEEHRKNWIKTRIYEYYQDHTDSVKKYGTIQPEMKMTPGEYARLQITVRHQNAEREQFLDNWTQSIRDKAKPIM